MIHYLITQPTKDGDGIYRKSLCGTWNDGDSTTSRRVLSIRGVTRAFGGRTTGTKSGARQIPPFLASASLKPYIPNDLMARVLSPVEYIPLGGGRTVYGFDATLLPDVCRVILEADRANALKSNQKYLVAASEALLARNRVTCSLCNSELYRKGSNGSTDTKEHNS